MSAQISPMLAVSDGNKAIEFYKKAFGAEELWRLDNNSHIVACLSIHGANLFLATESPEYGTHSPDLAGFTTVRIELFVENPYEVHHQAVSAGATERDTVREHTYPLIGKRPFKRMLQSAVKDPFGHLWLIGKILE